MNPDSLEMLDPDPDPDSMNPDPQLWILEIWIRNTAFFLKESNRMNRYWIKNNFFWLFANFKNLFLYFWGGFFVFFVLYSTLLHLPPLRFRCADGCWDRTQNRENGALAVRRSNH
jgi:hypothetical protein